MGNYDVYLFGMILVTNSFLLEDEYPVAENYAEIDQMYVLPGGETGTCAGVLSGLGCTVKIDGNHMGDKTFLVIQSYYADKKVDLSALLVEKGYPGLMDYVLVGKETRTPFGFFKAFFADEKQRWNEPKKKDIKEAKVVGIDPFFKESSIEAAKLCVACKRPYVTIDAPFDSYLATHAAINIVSNECLHNHYANRSRESVFNDYIKHAKGLVILTDGPNKILYGRKDARPRYFMPYSISVRSTLGAGDTFKAACIYALLNKYDDEKTVQFASACAGIACMRFPLLLHLPTKDRVDRLIEMDV